MSSSTLHPPRLLKITVGSTVTTVNSPVWPSDGSAYAGAPYQWIVTLVVTPQIHSDPNTPTPYAYIYNDVIAGDWLSNATGGMTWKILSISSTSAVQQSVTCVVEDVHQFNAYNDPTTNGYGGPQGLIQGFLFTLDQYSNPILVPVVPNVLQYTWQTDVIGRFLFSPPS